MGGGTGLACLLASWFFWKEKGLDPLRAFLGSPDDFEFVEGRITQAAYLAGKNRGLDRMVIEGHAKLPGGKELPILEFFSPWRPG